MHANAVSCGNIRSIVDKDSGIAAARNDGCGFGDQAQVASTQVAFPDLDEIYSSLHSLADLVAQNLVPAAYPVVEFMPICYQVQERSRSVWQPARHLATPVETPAPFS